jgi:hypothetical protein
MLLQGMTAFAKDVVSAGNVTVKSMDRGGNAMVIEADSVISPAAMPVY